VSIQCNLGGQRWTQRLFVLLLLTEKGGLAISA